MFKVPNVFYVLTKISYENITNVRKQFESLEETIAHASSQNIKKYDIVRCEIKHEANFAHIKKDVMVKRR